MEEIKEDGSTCRRRSGEFDGDTDLELEKSNSTSSPVNEEEKELSTITINSAQTSSTLEDLQNRYKTTKDAEEKVRILNELAYFEGTDQIRANYLQEFVMDDTNSESLRSGALLSLAGYSHYLDVAVKAKLSDFIKKILDDETISLQNRCFILRLLNAPPPAPTLLKLINTLSEPNAHPGLLSGLFSAADNCSDPTVQEKIEKFLEINPQLRLAVINYLPNDEKGLKLRTKYALALAMNETYSQEIRMEALEILASHNYVVLIKDKKIRAQLDQIVLTFLNDEKIPLKERINFLPLLKEPPSIEALSSLMEILNHDDTFVENELSLLLFYAVNCPNPEVQQKLENFFLKKPQIIIENSIVRSHSGFLQARWIRMFLEISEETKKNLLLEKIHKLMKLYEPEESAENEISAKKKYVTAKFILEYSSNPEFIENAAKVLFNLIETTHRKHSYLAPGGVIEKDISALACNTILKFSSNAQLKESIIGWLFESVEKKSAVDLFIFQCQCLKVLLKQRAQEVRTKALELCQGIINCANVEDLSHRLGLTILFKQLWKVAAEQSLCCAIEEKLRLKFNEILSPDKEGITDDGSPSNAAPGDDETVEMFLFSSDEMVRQKAYEYFKNVIMNGDDHEAEIALDIIVRAVGEEHAWAQEVIDLSVGRENIDHPHSSFALHKILLEKVKEKVEHHPSFTKLEDGRFVTFNLKTLKTCRQNQNIPFMKHAKFLELTNQLIKEVSENTKELAHYQSITNTIPLESLLNVAENNFFKQLLDSDKATAPSEKVSLTSLKLRHILAKAKEEKELAKRSLEELSSQSKLILQLVINVMNCHTNKEDGIDHTYRLSSAGAIVSEEKMQSERLVDSATKFIMEDLRQKREGLLGGAGPVVKQLLFGKDGSKEGIIIEPPHQAKYLLNLLGAEIGTFLEGGKISFDTNGGAVDPKIRQYSKQQVLDVLYEYFKTENVIKHYTEKFNNKEFKIGLSGQDRSSALITELLSPSALRDTKYVVFENEDPQDDFIAWKPLAIAEVLLRLGILEEVKP